MKLTPWNTLKWLLSSLIMEKVHAVNTALLPRALLLQICFLSICSSVRDFLFLFQIFFPFSLASHQYFVLLESLQFIPPLGESPPPPPFLSSPSLQFLSRIPRLVIASEILWRGTAETPVFPRLLSPIPQTNHHFWSLTSIFYKTVDSGF